MKKTPRVLVIAIGVLGGWVAVTFVAILMLQPGPGPTPCSDERPGLWLRFGGERPQLSGRAPTAAKAMAVIVAVDHWGYPLSTVCGEGVASDPMWTQVVTAVYRAPLANLRVGEVLVRPDLVIIAGQAWSHVDRDKIESAVRANLAAAGLASVPTLIEIGVSPDPALLRRIEGLPLRFDSRSADVPSDTRTILGGLVQELGRTDSRIVLIGHADSTGRTAGNAAISQRRADAVKELLVNGGVSPHRITAIGAGDRMPVADNGTPEGRAANRAVVVELVTSGDR